MAIWILLTVATAAPDAGPPPAEPAALRAIGSGHRMWRMSEFEVPGAPTPPNPFDAGAFAVDVDFVAPSGSVISVPAFWYQDYTRALVDGSERFTETGAPHWRVRFTPREAGAHAYTVRFSRAGVQESAGTGGFDVAPADAGARGFIRVEPAARRYFQYEDGTPLPLLGACYCWPGARGSFDYDDWLPACAEAGMNYTRLWMWPHRFGIEVRPEERLHYNLQEAWRLDYVMNLAGQKGICIMLCLDFHGMFQDKPDNWGGNDYWPSHPYNQSQGGPCATQNDFFTNPEARRLYQLRLRYILARYGALPNLMAWQFFNEINNVYPLLQPRDVVAWHKTMAEWFHTQDPYHHLVSTSFSGWPDAPEMWSLPGLDFTQCHVYLTGPDTREGPAVVLPRLSSRFHEAYGKPTFVGEYGISSRGFHKEWDPHFRGLRQSLWAGLLSGAAGTPMSWWWEHLHDANLYPLWRSLARFIEGTGFGGPDWRPAPVEPAEGVTALAMTDGRQYLLWLLDNRFSYPKGATQDAKTATGFQVSLPGAKDGLYAIQWWNTREGSVIADASAECRQGALRVETVPFEADVAARITPRAGS